MIPPTVRVPPIIRMVDTVEKNKQVEEYYLKDLLSYFLLRSRLTYGYTEILHYLLNCKCLRRHRKHRYGDDLLSRRQDLYYRGNEKLERELDVINLIKSIRQLRLMGQILLTPSEKLLLKF